MDKRGKDHFQDWLDALRDRQAKVSIIRQVVRLAFVYFAFVGRAAILLTYGDTKRTQERDIAAAIDSFEIGKTAMAKTHRSHEDATIEMFEKDSSLAADYFCTEPCPNVATRL